MIKKAHAIVFQSPDEVGHGDFDLKPLAPDEILVETAYTFVSPGTEMRVLSGYYSQNSPFPIVPGYCVVGRVVEVGSEVTGFRVGDWISGGNPRPLQGIKSLWGGQASAHVYATSGNRPALLPRDCDPLDYVITEVAAIALRGALSARPVSGESAVVIGQGIIGALSAAWLNAAGCRVAVVDLEDSRLERALKLGAAFAVRGDDEDVLARLRTFLGGGADITVEATGAISGVELAYQLPRAQPTPGGAYPRLVMQATYRDKVSHNPHGFVAGAGVTILSPQDRGLEERQRAVEALRRGQIRSADFLDWVAPVADAPAAYEALKRRERFSVVFDWKVGK